MLDDLDKEVPADRVQFLYDKTSNRTNPTSPRYLVYSGKQDEN